MMISFPEMAALLWHPMKIEGVLHVGAHLCEEESIYLGLGLPLHRIVWVEGDYEIARRAQSYNLGRKILHAVVSDIDGQEVTFYRTNNGASSAISPFAEHAKLYPHVKIVGQYPVETVTLKTLFERHDLRAEDLNFLNMDIQGAELRALRGMGDEMLKCFPYIYLEVETVKLYEDSALLPEVDSFLKSKGYERILFRETPGMGWGEAFYSNLR